MWKYIKFLESVVYKNNPAHLTFFVTARCNAKCKMCFYWKNLNKDTNELSLEEIRKISEKMGRLLWVVFTGGEPYLRNDLPEIVELFCKNCKPKFTTIATNGLLTDKITKATEKILKTCDNSKLRLKISLDGIGKEHDKIRGIENGYEKIMDTYKNLSELKNKYSNFDIGFTVTHSHFNEHNIKDIIDFTINSELFSANMPPSINLVRGCTREDESRLVSLEECKSNMKYLERKLQDRYKRMDLVQKLLIADEYVGKEIALEIIERKVMVIPCYAGVLSIVITETGELHPCEILGKSLGNLRNNNYDPHQILNSEKANLVKKFITNYRCYCTHECNMFVNTLFNFHIYPRIVKKYFEILKN